MDYSQFKKLEFRRKFWKLFGAQISVNDPATNQQVGFIKMKAWKLKEDVRLYRDASMQQELLRIQARSIIDFGATYDVYDTTTEQPLVSLRRKGLKSTFVRDHWELFTPAGAPFGYIEETSSNLAIARRWVGIIPYLGDSIELIFAFIPQKYDIFVSPDGTSGPLLAAHVTHRKNPIIVKMELDTTVAQVQADPRIGIAACSLLSIIDASKNS